jgi:hypothetical protein
VRHRGRLAALAALASALTWVSVGPAAALDEGPRLGLRAVGQSTSYFDLTLRPGETQTLEIEITNDGDAPADAHTYAADVYTIVNGGFGGRLRGEPRSGATRWLDYDAETLELASGARSRRSFTVTVPGGAGPGEYITSLVLERELPASVADAVGARQVQRQAVAVVVTVPGERRPTLKIGDASHVLMAGVSVLSVAVSNPGNVRLNPVVEVVLRDSRGTPVSTATMQMDSFYAVTKTTVEIPLGAERLTGSYSVDIVAEDVQQGVRSTARDTFVVDGAAPGEGIPLLTTVMRIGSTDIPVVLVIALLGGVALAAATMRMALRRRHGMRRS